LAAVLRARDDFLAGIAAFLEVDAAEDLEVHHLRHELVLRRRGDERAAGADFLQVPGFLVSSTAQGGRVWARRCGGLEAQDALSPTGTLATWFFHSIRAGSCSVFQMPNCAQASLSSAIFTLERSTNIDRRFATAGARSRASCSR
jgi:hypothetical protein